MRSTRKIAGFLAAGTVAAAAFAAPAGAATIEDQYPETPKLNPTLPIVNTSHGSDHIKANVLNPHPVCNSAEDYRTVVYKVDDNFTPAGTISTNNQSSKEIPLTQDLSKTQSISISIKGDRTDETSANFGGEASGDSSKGSIGIAKSITSTIGAEFSYSLSWETGQTIGPYDVPAGHTGEATYGFRTINMTGTQQYCKPDGTWSNPTPWTAFVPVKNEVRVKTYENAADSRVETPRGDNRVQVDESVKAPEVQDGEAQPTVEA